MMLIHLTAESGRPVDIHPGTILSIADMMGGAVKSQIFSTLTVVAPSGSTCNQLLNVRETREEIYRQIAAVEEKYRAEQPSNPAVDVAKKMADAMLTTAQISQADWLHQRIAIHALTDDLRSCRRWAVCTLFSIVAVPFAIYFLAWLVR